MIIAVRTSNPTWVQGHVTCFVSVVLTAFLSPVQALPSPKPVLCLHKHCLFFHTLFWRFKIGSRDIIQIIFVSGSFWNITDIFTFLRVFFLFIIHFFFPFMNFLQVINCIYFEVVTGSSKKLINWSVSQIVMFCLQSSSAVLQQDSPRTGMEGGWSSRNGREGVECQYATRKHTRFQLG